jgi:hypothetical protein
MQIDQDIMEKVQAIRDKTGKYTSFDIVGDAYESGANELRYIFTSSKSVADVFPTREALIAHMDGILENLRPKD